MASWKAPPNAQTDQNALPWTLIHQSALWNESSLLVNPMFGIAEIPQQGIWSQLFFQISIVAITKSPSKCNIYVECSATVW
jgi:hypothetical protein